MLKFGLVRLLGYAALGCLLVGCGARREYVVQALQAEQLGWDTVRVDVAFASQTLLGTPNPARPDSVQIRLYDDEAQRLNTVSAETLWVRDAALGDRERLLVEACGYFVGHQICEQTNLFASPKRYVTQVALDYPTDTEMQQGRYEIRVAPERAVFGKEEQWEAITRTSQSAIQLALTSEGVTITHPLRLGRHRLNLGRQTGFSDFKYEIDSRLFEGEDAEIQAKITLFHRQDEITVLDSVIVIANKSNLDRAAEVYAFAEQALGQIDAQMHSLVGEATVAFVRTWNYQSLRDRYEIELRLERTAPGWNAQSFYWEGLLEVDEDGRQAQFTLQRGNRSGNRAWYNFFDSELVSLRNLNPPERHTPTADSTWQIHLR